MAYRILSVGVADHPVDAPAAARVYEIRASSGEDAWRRLADEAALTAFRDEAAALGADGGGARYPAGELFAAEAPSADALAALTAFLQGVCDRSIRYTGAYALMRRFYVEAASPAEPADLASFGGLAIDDDASPAHRACRREFAEYRARAEVEIAGVRVERDAAEASLVSKREAWANEARAALARKTRDILAAVTARDAATARASAAEVDAMYRLATSALETARAEATRAEARAEALAAENARLKSALDLMVSADAANRLTTSASESSGSDDGKYYPHGRRASCGSAASEDLCPELSAPATAS